MKNQKPAMKALGLLRLVQNSAQYVARIHSQLKFNGFTPEAWGSFVPALLRQASHLQEKRVL